MRWLIPPCLQNGFVFLEIVGDDYPAGFGFVELDGLVFAGQWVKHRPDVGQTFDREGLVNGNQAGLRVRHDSGRCQWYHDGGQPSRAGH